jgi:hypothetical protein
MQHITASSRLLSVRSGCNKMVNREHVAHAALQLYNLELPARVAKNFVAPSLGLAICPPIDLRMQKSISRRGNGLRDPSKQAVEHALSVSTSAEITSMRLRHSGGSPPTHTASVCCGLMGQTPTNRATTLSPFTMPRSFPFLFSS